MKKSTLLLSLVLSFFIMSMQSNAQNCSITSIPYGDATACDPETGEYNQDVGINFRNPPSSGYLVVNDKRYTFSTSPLRITLTGIVANENPYPVEAYFDEDPDCKFSTTIPTKKRIECVAVSMLVGEQTACNPATGTYTQELIIKHPYSHALIVDILLSVDDYAYQYPQQTFTLQGQEESIKLTGLIADGKPLQMELIYIKPNGYSNSIEFDTGVFTAPPDCGQACNIYKAEAYGGAECDTTTKTYTQGIELSYTNPPSSGNISVNGQTFPMQTTPQVVYLTGLQPDGLGVDVTAFFDSSDCDYSSTFSSVFTSPDNCLPPPPPEPEIPFDPSNDPVDDPDDPDDPEEEVVMKKITITSLYCESQITGPGSDDVIFLVQLDGGPPARHKIIGRYEMPGRSTSDNPVAPMAEFYFEKNAYISLWDCDGVSNFVNSADMCGSFNIASSLLDVPQTFYTLGDHDAMYKMEFLLTESSKPISQKLGTISSDVGNAIATLQGKVQDALNDWDDYTDVVGMSGTSELNEALTNAVSSGILDDIVNWLTSDFMDGHKVIDLLPVKALSLGIMGQAEIFTGISGNFGCAADLSNVSPENFDDNYTIYAGGGLVEGADAGLEAAIAVGIWFDEVTDIGGWMVGGEVDIADGAGGSAVAYCGKDDKDEFTEAARDSDTRLELAKVIFLGIDVGLDEGVEAEESYFFAGHLESAQVAQTGDFDHQAILDWTICRTMDDDVKDEVFFYFYADDDDTQYRYPIWNEIQMNDSGSGAVNQTNIYYSPHDAQPNVNEMKTYRPGGQMIQFNDHFRIHLHVNGYQTNHTVYLSDFTGDPLQAAIDFEDHGYHYQLKFHLED